MKHWIIWGFISLWMSSSVYAISKEDFLKIAFVERRKYAVIDGTYSSEYAIPREEYRKLSDETILAIQLEIQRQQFLYVQENIGKKRKELDMSRLYNLGNIAVNYFKDPGILYPEEIINYATIGGYCGSHFKGAEYYYKDYLEWKKHELGQPSLWTHPGGDADAISAIVFFYEDHKMYKEWAALYADYNDFWWKKQATPYCNRFPHIKDCVSKWLDNNHDYQDFLIGWKGIKKLARTTKPKPLSIQVQNHEWFYSDKQEEVLKALEYYHDNKVKFMLEMAVNHKDSVITLKAQDYLKKLYQVEKNEGKIP